MIGDIVRQTLNLLASVVQMLLSQAMRLLGVILEAMGIFGKIIGTVIGLICQLQACAKHHNVRGLANSKL